MHVIPHLCLMFMVDIGNNANTVFVAEVPRMKYQKVTVLMQWFDSGLTFPLAYKPQKKLQ